MGYPPPMYPQMPPLPPGTPGYLPPGYPKPPRSVADLTVSLIILALTVLLGAAAAFFGLLSLAFLDNCAPATCSAEGAVTAVLVSLIAAGGSGLVGLVLTIIRLTRRNVAWPYALVTLGVCTLVLVAGGVGFITAVGG